MKKKQKQDTRIRRVQEERHLQDIYKKKLEEIREKHLAEARKQAEDCNEFIHLHPGCFS